MCRGLRITWILLRYAQRARYAGPRVAGGGQRGHSAFNALLDLVRLADAVPGTTLTWVVRRAMVGGLFGGAAGQPGGGRRPARAGTGGRDHRRAGLRPDLAMLRELRTAAPLTLSLATARPGAAVVLPLVAALAPKAKPGGGCCGR